MRPRTHSRKLSAIPGNSLESGRAPTLLLVAVSFLCGAAAGSYWFYRVAGHTPTADPKAESRPADALSASTLALLQRLNSPVEIKFYSVLDPATASDAVKSFSARASQLLAEYQRAGGGKIKLTPFDSEANNAANTALADGLTAFNVDKGDACFLGLTVNLNGKKETLPLLSPDWPAALEPDISRAMARVVDTTAQARAVTAPVVDPAVIADVRRTLTNVDTLPVDRGAEVLRDAAYKEFKTAAAEMDAQVKEAQQRLVQAQSGGSEADVQAARQHLQQIQADQMEKLKQIAAKSKAQIDALKQLKAGGQ